MGSDEELELDDEEGEEEGDYEEESEYENGEEEDDDEEEDDEEEEEDDVQDSATEIETDSEFDQNSNVDVRLGPQGIPTIVVNESEAEQLKKSTDQLANGNGLDGHQAQVEPVAAERALGDPKPCYVDQYISLENARPLQRTLSNDDGRTAGSPTAPTRSGVLAYLRRHEQLERSPSATDMMASKNSLELKKKYLLDYGGSTGSLAQKSASTTNLDSKLKSFVDTISEAQKKLNPAPQPSVPMQVSIAIALSRISCFYVMQISFDRSSSRTRPTSFSRCSDNKCRTSCPSRMGKQNRLFSTSRKRCTRRISTNHRHQPIANLQPTRWPSNPWKLHR